MTGQRIALRDGDPTKGVTPVGVDVDTYRHRLVEPAADEFDDLVAPTDVVVQR